LVRSVVARAQPSQPRTSRFRGVSWNRAGRFWKAQIYAHGQTRYLGRFRGDGAEEQAARAYDRATRELRGDKAQLSFASVSGPQRSDAVSQTKPVEACKAVTDVVPGLVRSVVARAQPNEPRTSRFRGVSWNRARRCWKAQITAHGQTRHLGTFRGDEAEEQAARAYDRAARELHGDKAQLNFASVPGPQRSDAVSQTKPDEARKAVTAVVRGLVRSVVARAQPDEPRTSRFRGVSWDRATRCWKAQITAHGQNRSLGTFRGDEAEEQAARAYDRAARELHGDQAQLSFASVSGPQRSDAVSQTNTDEMHKVTTGARTESSKHQAVPIEQSSSHHPANLSNVRQVRAVQGSPTNLPRPVEEQPHPSSVSVDDACRCAMTRCLKLYCSCFRDGRPCGPQCNCRGCKNDLDREANCEWIAAEAHRQTQLSKKRKTDGCNCKAARCLKKYCVCFRAGRQCDSSCQCISCANCFTTEGGC
jgi:hypothetical protein